MTFTIIFPVLFVFFKVEFQAIDGSYVTSPSIMVHVSVRVAETNAPRVTWNMGTYYTTVIITANDASLMLVN